MKLKLQKFFEKKENLYSSVALFFGLVFCFYNPPFAGVPDEHAHYLKALSVTEGQWRCNGSLSISESAYWLPDQIKPIEYPGVKGQRINTEIVWQKLWEKDSGKKEIIGGVNCPATPIGYLPQVIGLKIGQWMHLSALGSFYFARLLNMLVAIFVVYLAIRIAPFGKLIFLLVGLLPMTVQQFSSLSYDPLAISFAFLFAAFVLKLAVDKDKKITPKEIVILLLLSIFGLNVKPGYFLISFLIFILPFSKFGSKRKYWLFTSLVTALNVTVFLALRKVFADLGGLQEGVDPAAQLSGLLHAPWNFLVILWNSWDKSHKFYFETFLFKSGWLKVSLDSWWYWFVSIGAVLFLWQEDEKNPLNIGQRVIFFLVFLANFVLVYLSLYLVWTKVGFSTVSGVQGRYFLAISPLLIFALYKIPVRNFKIRIEFLKKYRELSLAIFFLIAYVFALFYVNSLYYDKTPSAKYLKKINEQKKNTN